MKKRLLALLLVSALLLLSACGALSAGEDTLTQIEDSQVLSSGEDTLTRIEDPQVRQSPEMPDPEDPSPGEEEEISSPEEAVETVAGDPETPPAGEVAGAVTEDGEYTSPEDVAAYLHLYGHLPSNFITKSQARDLGWDNSRGNLWDVAPGKSIGGDRFGNYEGLLPDTTKYKECDVNYTGGYRGAERLIFGEDGSVYYTGDHYNSFTQLY